MKHMGCFLANPTRTRTRLTTVLQEGGIGFLKLQLGHTFIAVEGNTSAPSKVYWLFLGQIDLGSSLIRLASDKAPNRTQKNIHVQKRGIYWKIHWKHTTNGKLSNNGNYMQLLYNILRWSHRFGHMLDENVGAKPANCHEVSQSPCISYYSIIPCIHKFWSFQSWYQAILEGSSQLVNT